MKLSNRTFFDMAKKPLLALCLTIIPFSLHGANVFVGQGLSGIKLLRIEGDIVKGDFEKVKTLSAEVMRGLLFKHETFRISINSKGGDIIEAIKIGRFAREILAKVMVIGINIVSTQGQLEWLLKNLPATMYRLREMGVNESIEEHLRKCYSACILIFYGGVEREISNNLDNRAGRIVIPIMGLHRPYFDKKMFSKLKVNEAKKKYKELEIFVKTYLTEMGAPNALIARMFESASNEVDLLDADEFSNYYQDKEPFYEEWQIAKCGDNSHETVLTNDELEFYQKYEKALPAEIKRLYYSGDPFINADRIYPPGFSKKKIDRIKDKLDRNYNEFKSCHAVQRYRHQSNVAYDISE